MRIFAEVPIRDVKRQYGNRKRQSFINAFGRYIFGTLGNKANVNLKYVVTLH